MIISTHCFHCARICTPLMYVSTCKFLVCSGQERNRATGRGGMGRGGWIGWVVEVFRHNSDHVDVIMASCWQHLDIILVSFRNYFANFVHQFDCIPASCWHCSGIILKGFWHHFTIWLDDSGIILASTC